MTALAPAVSSWADISEDGRYRYELGRRWAPGLLAAWIMLNPSTADATANDQTITQIVKHSKRLGMGGLVVVNLFALRSAFPSELSRADDPVGPRNEASLRSVLDPREPDVGQVVVAWGTWLANQPAARRPKPPAIGALLNRSVLCLGKTKSGEPKHPCRLSDDTPWEVWR